MEEENVEGKASDEVPENSLLPVEPASMEPNSSAEQLTSTEKETNQSTSTTITDQTNFTENCTGKGDDEECGSQPENCNQEITEKIIPEVNAKNEINEVVLNVANDYSEIVGESVCDKTTRTAENLFENEMKNEVVIKENKPETESDGKHSEAAIAFSKLLSANYRSDSDSDSIDSESDSSDTSEDSSSDSLPDSDIKNNKNGKKHSNPCATDLLVCNLPPIEDLKISVPEQDCVEIGVITSIVDTLVVVESYKGTAALDIDTVLFLECGKRPLGKVFEILGPISEPIYAVRFNDKNQIASKLIEKGMKVYCAPQTQHTTFVFLSEVLKCRGSDASWKDNIEAPSEFQDFSDDEEESKFKKMNGGKLEGVTLNGAQGSRKRPFNSQQPSNNIIQPGRLQNSSPQNPRFSSRGRFRSAHPRNPFATAPTRPHGSGPPNSYPYYPQNVNYYGGYPYPVPHSNFPLPNFRHPQFANSRPERMRPPYFLQGPQAFPGFSGHWGMPSMPPPPPPPQNEEPGARQPKNN